jgi:hypothetical protein
MGISLEDYLTVEETEENDFDPIDEAIGVEHYRRDLIETEKLSDTLYNGFESFMDDVRSAYTFMEENKTPSMESLQELDAKLTDLADTLGLTRERVSVESIESVGDYYNVSVEELSDFVGRLIQVFSNDFVGFYDTMHRLFTGRVNSARHFKERIQETRSLWKGKKDAINSKRILSSYAGKDIYIAFRHDNKLDNDPSSALSKDQVLANKVLVDFTKKMSGYTKNVGSIIKSGRFDSKDEIVKTVIKKIGDLGNASEVFDSKLIVDKPILLTNVGWYIKKPKTKKSLGNGVEFKKFNDVITERMITRDNQMRKNLLVLHVFDDIELSYQDVESILDSLEKYCDDIIWFGNEFESVMKVHKDLNRYLTEVAKVSGANLDKTGTALLKQLMGFTKFLRKQQTRPINWEIERVLFVLSRATIYIRRAVKRVK